MASDGMVYNAGSCSVKCVTRFLFVCAFHRFVCPSVPTPLLLCTPTLTAAPTHWHDVVEAVAVLETLLYRTDDRVVKVLCGVDAPPSEDADTEAAAEVAAAPVALRLGAAPAVVVHFLTKAVRRPQLSDTLRCVGVRVQMTPAGEVAVAHAATGEQLSCRQVADVITTLCGMVTVPPAAVAAADSGGGAAPGPDASTSAAAGGGAGAARVEPALRLSAVCGPLYLVAAPRPPVAPANWCQYP